MNIAKWVVAILVLYFAGQVSLEHQKRLSRPKIVGGHEVKINSVPYLISLHHRKVGFLCGATVISSSWGLSAEHCLRKFSISPKQYFVRAGSSLESFGGTLHNVIRIHMINAKPSNGESDPMHDIMLFRVSPVFRFSDTVKPAKLPTEASVSPKWLQVSGWGRTDMSNKGNGSMFVLAVNVSKIEFEDCVRANDWYHLMIEKKRHLCYGENGADACFGDSGGPLADSNTIYGIVSFGDGCGTKPGIYVDVSFYRRWIKRITHV